MTKDDKITSINTDETQSDVSAENQLPPTIAYNDVPLVATESSQEQSTLNQISNVQNIANIVSTAGNSQPVEGSSTKVKDAEEKDKDININETVNENYPIPLLSEVTIQIEPPQNIQPEPSTSNYVFSSEPAVELHQSCHKGYPNTEELCPALLLEEALVQSHLPQMNIESKESSFEDLEQQESLSVEIKLNSDEDHSENVISEDAIQICPASVSPVVHEPVAEETKNKMTPCCSFLIRRYQIFIDQLDSFPVIYGLMLVIVITLSVTKLLEPHDANYDVFWSVFFVNLYCGLFSLLFEPGMCNVWTSNAFQGDCVCICCPCKESYNLSVVYKQSQHSAREESDINFEHEVADTSSLSALHVPPIGNRHEESLDSRSSKFLPESPMAIDVEVHGIKTPSYSSDGACGGNYPTSSHEGACGGNYPSSSHEGACGENYPSSSHEGASHETPQKELLKGSF